MNYARFSHLFTKKKKNCTMQHYSFESHTSQKGPWILSNSQTRSLTRTEQRSLPRKRPVAAGGGTMTKGNGGGHQGAPAHPLVASVRLEVARGGGATRSSGSPAAARLAAWLRRLSMAKWPKYRSRGPHLNT
jgi:hypothetical protein